jgi:hypothetical protein
VSHAIQSSSLSEAWLQASQYLLQQPGGKAVNLVVTFDGALAEVNGIRSALDAYGAAHRGDDGRPYSVDTVANTLFPIGLYAPHLGRGAAAQHLWRNHALAMRMQARLRVVDRDNYFNRLACYPGSEGPINQLDKVIRRLQGQSGQAGPLSSAYELALSNPDMDGDLRLQSPAHDRKIYGFPCLSHISLTFVRPKLHLTALYRNQVFIERAYGNYLGLARLARFIATEIGAEVGEIGCVATHADVELDYGKESLDGLFNRASEWAQAPVGES